MSSNSMYVVVWDWMLSCIYGVVVSWC